MQYGELYHRNYYKEVQELLGHSDVSTTMNVYAHSTRKAKRDSARLLNKVAGNDLKKFPLFPSRLSHKGKNKGKYISSHYLRG